VAYARELSEAIIDMREGVAFCSVCFHITDTDPCHICGDERRDRSLLCVVEEPLDVMAFERTLRYRGLYHVLHGALSPVEGIGPEDLKIAQLVGRVKAGEITEVVLATNPNVEGDTTAQYIMQLLKSFPVRVSQIARGLPMGGDLEYADEVTLGQALEHRRELRNS
jgi:recombination protein RecR